MIGAYAIEQDYSHYVSRQSSIIFGVVGTATKGDVNTPTLCTSTADFIRKFGPASADHIGMYAGLYYLNQGRQLYFCRAEGGTAAAKATVTIPGVNSSTPVASARVLTALTPGTFYNNLKVTVATSVIGYKITISEVDTGRTVETILYQIGDTFRSSYFELTVSATVTGLTTGNYTATGGTDSATGLTATHWNTATDEFSSELYDINLLAIPGISLNAVVTNALELASTRGDCLYLVDPPNNLDPDDVKDWHNAAGEYTSNTLLNNSYGALYWSWQKVYDNDSSSYIDLPPSAVVAAVMAKSARETEIWMPPAGLVRGLIQGVAEPVYSPDAGERDALYADQNAVNCIINDPTYGLVVFGQKTLLRTQTALNRVNVRMLLNYLKRVVVAAAKYLTFEPNDSTTWNAFEDLVEPTLRSIGQRRGLYAYKIVTGESIVTDDDIDNYRMPCKILIHIRYG